MSSREGLMRSPQEYSRTRSNHWQHPPTVVKKPQLFRYLFPVRKFKHKLSNLTGKTAVCHG